MVQEISKNIAQKHQDEKIISIMHGMTCEKDFQCCRSDSERSYHTKDFAGIYSIVECLDQTETYCKFKMPFSDMYNLCTCPVRVHITKKLGVKKTL